MSVRRIVRQFRVASSARDAHRVWRDHELLASELASALGISCAAHQHGFRTCWTFRGTHDSADLTWDTLITADVPGRLLAWSTASQEPFCQSWDLWFAERADGHGTDVRLALEFVSSVTDARTYESRNPSLDGAAHGPEDPLFGKDPDGILDHLIQRWQRLLAATR